MKRLVWLIPVLILAALLWLNGLEADAAPDGTFFLSAGQVAKVTPNGCTLSVVISNNNRVKVKCSGGVDAPAPTAPLVTNITLNPGQTAIIKASGCDLAVKRNTPSLVRVVCHAKPSPTPTTPTNTVKVGFGGTNYSPQQITIHVGETVHWTWSGSNHTVTSGTAPTEDNLFCSPNDLNCGTANPSNAGATYDHTFNSQGTFHYFCKIHGTFMTGTVVVQP